MDVASPVAVVTGGGRGIGRGIALALAELGHTVVVNYRSDAESAEETCREARSARIAGARAIRADVSDPAEGRRLLDEAMAVSGRIDLWVNNAGIAPERRLDLLETTLESWDLVLGTNLRGPFFLTQAVGPGHDRTPGGGDRRRAPDRVHHLDLEPVRQHHARRVLRGQGGAEHGGAALRRPAGRRGDPRL